MIIKKEDLKVEQRPAPRTGTLTKFLEPSQMHGKNRQFVKIILNPGAKNPPHKHEGDFEIFYILSGRGLVTDNGAVQEVKPGDVVFTDNGEIHGIENIGDTDLEYIALITYV
jgi:quercetin dioxygenase-like cupin family protein